MHQPRGGCCSATALLSMACHVPSGKKRKWDSQETFWLHLKATGRLETDYKFGIVTLCLSTARQKKHKLSHANVGGASTPSHHVTSVTYSIKWFITNGSCSQHYFTAMEITSCDQEFVLHKSNHGTYCTSKKICTISAKVKSYFIHLHSVCKVLLDVSAVIWQ